MNHNSQLTMVHFYSVLAKGWKETMSVKLREAETVSTKALEYFNLPADLRGNAV